MSENTQNSNSCGSKLKMQRNKVEIKTKQGLQGLQRLNSKKKKKT